ncbi:lipoyl synthase [Salibacteraceae bacterium]|jgi:lipoyl synthase|nr:lipoyl synthase [Salibacteraceae bacterium]MDA9266747.1 lipoyl synthase [Salibacteraceae bacterium]MDB4104531.1 lipoyl synthase [Salibacteraceae bacterium]MDC1304780.1 lipoyl synthase [Salibacteraceae bacterium]
MANLLKNKEDQEVRIKKPDWLKVKIPGGKEYLRVKEVVEDRNLHTICSSGKCPNQSECWSAGTATFMILGNTCTRSCQFCNVATGAGEEVDIFEPAKVADSIRVMGLKHAVITSVDRDDLPDGGANHWKKTIEMIRKKNPDVTIETLIPDFKGEWKNLDPILEVKPEVVSHNIETVERITKNVRIQAKYWRSMEVLKRLKEGGINRTKSGIMVGLGEEKEEVFQTLRDLHAQGVSVVTIGQYLQPSKKHLPVKDWVKPEVFAEYKEYGESIGIDHVESGPLVRSSYHAERHI